MFWMSSKVMPTNCCSGFFLTFRGLSLGIGDFLWMLADRSLMLLGLMRVLLLDCFETLDTLLLERTLASLDCFFVERTLGCLMADSTELLGGITSLDRLPCLSLRI